MKNNYKAIKMFVALLSLMAMKLGAAPLSGVYTINAGAAASVSNYTSFTAFAADLNTQGVSGPVTVNVVSGSGPYTEQITFNQITGASSVNKITINGNGNTLTFSANSTAPWTMLLNSADYITVNNLNVVGTGSYAYPVELYNGADYNTFTSCTFSVPANGTSTSQIPFKIDASTTSYGYTGITGNYNTVQSCTTSGGYYGIMCMGNSYAQPMKGNQFIGNSVLDSYYYGMYIYYYQDGAVAKNNIISRPNRTTITTYYYAFYTYYTMNTLVDGNQVTNIYNSGVTTTTGYYLYAFMLYYNGASYGNGAPVHTAPYIVRNNMVYNNVSNGYLYGLYPYCSDAEVYNNTISFDDQTATSSSTTYGIYDYDAAGYQNNVYNNVISISRQGTGTKYDHYVASTTKSGSVSRNCYYNGSTAGTNGLAYSGGTAYNNTNLNTFSANSFTVNPTFVSVSDVHPTNTTINNAGIVVPGLTFDALNAVRNTATPDIGALEFLTPNCASTPSLTSVLAPTYAICPGNSTTLGMNFLQTDAGISYQWQSSTISPVGPWTSIPGATGYNYTTPPVSGNTYYSALVTCANGNGSIQAVSGQVMVAGTTTNNVPYYENFEGVGYNGMLPNCSWYFGGSVSSYTAATSGYRFGRSSARFMSFAGSTAGTNYAYTNGVLLKAGVTYSAAAWYLTEFSGLTNFTDLSLLIGSSQTSTGLSSIVSSNGVVFANQYTPISGTFQVSSTGLYYMAIRVTNNSASDYLSIDDVSITIPCQLNAPALSVTGLTTACVGSPINLTATGADSYVWTNAANQSLSTTNALSNVPNQAGVTLYNVTGLNANSGCSAVLTKTVNVLAGPIVTAYMADPNNGVCPGEVAVLHALGSAVSYTWSTTGIAGANTTVSPSSMTTYTVMGSNNTNCISSAVITVNVKTPPSVSGAPNHNAICAGEPVVLTAQGADTYSWTSSSVVLLGNNVVAYPTQPTNYALTGVDAATGCSGTALVSVLVSACTGIATNVSADSNIHVYPNPNNGEFVVELNNSDVKNIHVTDVTGRVLATSTTSDASANFNISNLAAGVYYVKVQSSDKLSVIKIVKQ